MENVTLEKVLAEARQLLPEEQKRLRALLDAEIRWREGHKSIEQLAQEQGKRPVTFEELLGPEPDEDDDDDVDAFLLELREWRNTPSSRSID